MATEKAVEIIDIYTHKVEKRLDRLGTYLIFIVIPLLLIIMMKLIMKVVGILIGMAQNLTCCLKIRIIF